MIHLLKAVASLQERGVDLRSLTEALDSRTPTGKFSLVILSAVAQLERDVLKQRTLAGLEAARLRGRVGGTTLDHRRTDQDCTPSDGGSHSLSCGDMPRSQNSKVELLSNRKTK